MWNTYIFCVLELCHVPFCWSLSKIESCSSRLSASTFLSHSIFLWPLKTSCDVCLLRLQKGACSDSEEERVMEEVSSDACFLSCFSMLFPPGYSMCQVQGKGKRNRPWHKDPRRKRWKNTDRISTCRSKSPPFLSFSFSCSILLFLSLL